MGSATPVAFTAAISGGGLSTAGAGFAGLQAPSMLAARRSYSARSSEAEARSSRQACSSRLRRRQSSALADDYPSPDGTRVTPFTPTKLDPAFCLNNREYCEAFFLLGKRELYHHLYGRRRYRREERVSEKGV